MKSRSAIKFLFQPFALILRLCFSPARGLQRHQRVSGGCNGFRVFHNRPQLFSSAVILSPSLLMILGSTCIRSLKVKRIWRDFSSLCKVRKPQYPSRKVSDLTGTACCQHLIDSNALSYSGKALNSSWRSNFPLSNPQRCKWLAVRMYQTPPGLPWGPAPSMKIEEAIGSPAQAATLALTVGRGPSVCIHFQITLSGP